MSLLKKKREKSSRQHSDPNKNRIKIVLTFFLVGIMKSKMGSLGKTNSGSIDLFIFSLRDLRTFLNHLNPESNPADFPAVDLFCFDRFCSFRYSLKYEFDGSRLNSKDFPTKWEAGGILLYRKQYGTIPLHIYKVCISFFIASLLHLTLFTRYDEIRYFDTTGIEMTIN